LAPSKYLFSASVIASKYCEPTPVSRIATPGVMPVMP